MSRGRAPVATRWWLAGWLVPAVVQLGLGAVDKRPIGTAALLFWVVVLGAGGCALTSAWLIRRAMVDDSAELGFLGAYSWAVSVLPLVHGLTVPGVLYGPNDATASSIMLAVPLGVLAASPLVATADRSVVVRHWQLWIGVNVALATTLAVALLLDPALLAAAEPGSATAIVAAVTGFAGSLAISARHLRLYRISRRPAVLIVAVGIAFVGVAGLSWINSATMSAGFWFAHIVDLVGVFSATVVGALLLRRRRIEVDVFRPLTLRDPLDALEYGLDPVVHAFVSDLGRKDDLTRDHVRRTAESAMRVGEALDIEPDELRRLGLGALLHDIGKIEIPDEILNKPGRLTDEEFAVMKDHARLGAQLVSDSPVLRDIAPIIHHHHERFDGDGYPDRLAGTGIPLAARIVSVCDAWDALVNDRHYRSGMDEDRARAILTEHAGSQWDPAVVGTFLELLDADRIPAVSEVLAEVGGDTGQFGATTGCGCVADNPVLIDV